MVYHIYLYMYVCIHVTSSLFLLGFHSQQGTFRKNIRKVLLCPSVCNIAQRLSTKKLNISHADNSSILNLKHIFYGTSPTQSGNVIFSNS